MADDPLVPQWLSALLETVEAPSRGIDTLEVFSGRAQLTRAFQMHGLITETFDHRNCLTQDVFTMPGFLLLLLLVLSVKAGGLIWFAPPCSSCVFLSHSNHKRQSLNGYSGDLQAPAVLQANHLVCCVAALIRLALSRGVEVVVEQPADSCMFKFPVLAKATQAFGGVQVQTYLGSFCDSFPCVKPLRLRSSSRWILELYRNKPLDLQAAPGVYKHGPGNSVSGGSSLAATSAYPIEFGLEVPALISHFSFCYFALIAESACHSRQQLPTPERKTPAAEPRR